MQFTKIPNPDTYPTFGHVEFSDEFNNFVKDYNIVGVHWSEPTTISASYLLRLLTEGVSARARGHHRHGFTDNADDASNELTKYYSSLFDHGALWKLANGYVICTAMPYSEKKVTIEESFEKLKNEFNYPDSIKLLVLDDRYKYRASGDFMILIYFDSALYV